ncbi:MAG: peptide ABC transporter substrate-binding protein [Verrucomicrobia bacterium]|nr:peptide ABC transporter substrate-binding protein [Verrucomicrobiota bacterium]
MKLFSKSALHCALVASCALSLAAASCQKKAPPPVSKIQNVHLNLKSEPPTLDPRKGGDVISSHMHFLLFEGLVRLNPDNSITPAQAKSFEISEDGMLYTFTLRDSRWSNGDPVTAYDFEKSWKDILDPSFPSVNAHLLYPIKNAEAAKKGRVPLSEVGIVSRDAKTFVVTLEKPTPYFLDLISFCVFFPVNSRIDKETPDWAYNAGEHFVSNGPFVLKEWKHNNEIVAARNSSYWDTSRVRPDSIHFSMIDNEMTALQMFESGKLDMIGEPLSPLPLDALPSLKKKGVIQKNPVAGTTMITFNVDKAPFNNVKVRKAFAYAIDRSSIVNNITQMDELAACNAVPPVLKNNRNHAFFKDADASYARALLEEGMKELGITKDVFKEFSYYYSTSDINHKVAQAIQQQWQNVLGVQIKLENLDHKILMDKLTKRDYALAQSLWVAQYNDQMNILERFKYKTNAKNYANWENPEYIQLLEDSFYVNGTQRAEILEKAEGIFLSEMPICPIYHWEMAYMIQPHLNDVGITPIGDVVFENLILNVRKPVR